MIRRAEPTPIRVVATLVADQPTSMNHRKQLCNLKINVTDRLNVGSKAAETVAKRTSIFEIATHEVHDGPPSNRPGILETLAERCRRKKVAGSKEDGDNGLERDSGCLVIQFVWQVLEGYVKNEILMLKNKKKNWIYNEKHPVKLF